MAFPREGSALGGLGSRFGQGATAALPRLRPDPEPDPGHVFQIGGQRQSDATEQQVVSLPDGTNMTSTVSRSQLRRRRQSFVLTDELPGNDAPTEAKQMLETACAKLFGWQQLPSALRGLVTSGFELQRVPGTHTGANGDEHPTVIVKESFPIDRMLVVAEGEFEAISRNVGDSEIVLRKYGIGDSMCEAALSDVAAISMVTIRCASKEGGRVYVLNGDLYRKIVRKQDTLNENVTDVDFLRSTGYYDDVEDMRAIARTFSKRTFSSPLELREGVYELENEPVPMAQLDPLDDPAEDEQPAQSRRPSYVLQRQPTMPLRQRARSASPVKSVSGSFLVRAVSPLKGVSPAAKGAGSVLMRAVSPLKGRREDPAPSETPPPRRQSFVISETSELYRTPTMHRRRPSFTSLEDEDSPDVSSFPIRPPPPSQDPPTGKFGSRIAGLATKISGTRPQRPPIAAPSPSRPVRELDDDESRAVSTDSAGFVCLIKSGRVLITLGQQQDDWEDSMGRGSFSKGSGQSTGQVYASELSSDGSTRSLRTADTSFSLGPGDPISLARLSSLVNDPSSHVSFATSQVTLMLHPASTAYLLPMALRRDMEKIYLRKLLQAIPVFHAEFTTEEISKLIDATTRVAYPQGTEVFTEGKIGPRILHVVYSGKASIRTGALAARTNYRRRSTQGESMLRLSVENFLKQFDGTMMRATAGVTYGESTQKVKLPPPAVPIVSPRSPERKLFQKARTMLSGVVKMAGAEKGKTDRSKAVRQLATKGKKSLAARKKAARTAAARKAAARSSPSTTPTRGSPMAVRASPGNSKAARSPASANAARGGDAKTNSSKLTAENVERLRGNGPQRANPTAEQTTDTDPSTDSAAPGVNARANQSTFTPASVLTPNGRPANSNDGITKLQSLHVGDHFGVEAFLSSRTQDAGTQFKAPSTVRVESTRMRCLLFDAAACGPLYERMLFVFSREHTSWRWAVANRNPVQFGHLVQGRTLGIGSFGRVKLVVHNEGGIVSPQTSKAYALKIIPRRKLWIPRHVQMLRRERDLLAKCGHPLIVRLISSYQNTLNTYLLLHLELGGELYALLKREGRLPLQSVRFYSACILSVLAYFDSNHIAYRDLKPENLLLDWHGYLKVIDLGFARTVTDGWCFTFCGTPDYMAPEIIKAEPHNQAVDMWALGVLLYEMLLGHPPWHYGGMAASDDFDRVYNAILSYASLGPRAKPPVPPFCFNEEAADLIAQLMCVSQGDRPKPVVCMEHPFFSEIDFLDLERRVVEAPFIPEMPTDKDLAILDSDDSDEYSDSEEESSVVSFDGKPSQQFHKPDHVTGQKSRVIGQRMHHVSRSPRDDDDDTPLFQESFYKPGPLQTKACKEAFQQLPGFIPCTDEELIAPRASGAEPAEGDEDELDA
jgi:serine/threonine protein kinase/CRP-like cAMP-binding protein